MPPKSSVAAVWTVEGFGSGKGTSGGIAPIHFGDTASGPEKSDNGGRPATKPVGAVIAKKKPTKAAPVSAAARKARR
jgi:hypothetical protein